MRLQEELKQTLKEKETRSSETSASNEQQTPLSARPDDPNTKKIRKHYLVYLFFFVYFSFSSYLSLLQSF